MKIGIHDIGGKVEKLKNPILITKTEYRDGQLAIVVKV